LYTLIKRLKQVLIHVEQVATHVVLSLRNSVSSVCSVSCGLASQLHVSPELVIGDVPLIEQGSRSRDGGIKNQTFLIRAEWAWRRPATAALLCFETPCRLRTLHDVRLSSPVRFPLGTWFFYQRFLYGGWVLCY